METKDLSVTQEISIADDFLIQVAEQAEKRIDAVIKIKKIALKVTNPRDWTDQNGNPYLGVSGSEKVANLFNISWRIDEPIYEEESDGHYTYTYKGYFSLGSRNAEAEGSRSSKDSFFMQYKYKDEKGNELKPRQEIPITERTNKRDVKMAALTNLLGNGITRILGIRNLTWDDLKEFAGITKEQVTSIQYKKHSEPIQEPQKKNGEREIKNPNAPATEAQTKALHSILGHLKVTDDFAKHSKVSQILGLQSVIESFSKLTKGQASTAIEALQKEAQDKK